MFDKAAKKRQGVFANSMLSTIVTWREVTALLLHPASREKLL